MTLTTIHHIRQRAAWTRDRLPSGWWLMPCGVIGAAGWAGLIWSIVK